MQYFFQNGVQLIINASFHNTFDIKSCYIKKIICLQLFVTPEVNSPELLLWWKVCYYALYIIRSQTSIQWTKEQGKKQNIQNICDEYNYGWGGNLLIYKYETSVYSEVICISTGIYFFAKHTQSHAKMLLLYINIGYGEAISNKYYTMITVR